MDVFTVSASTIARCPQHVLTPLHYLGAATGCRCTEIEDMLATARTTPRADLVFLEVLDIKPRYLKALEHAKVTTAADVVALGPRLSKVRGLDLTGMTAVVYALAPRGIKVPGISDLAPGRDPLRVKMQRIWENISRER